MSYSRFLEFVNSGTITSVNLKEGGAANFRGINPAGLFYGQVNLAGPVEQFVELCQKNNIDLSITYNDPNQADYSQIAIKSVAALVLVGIVALFQRNSTVGFGGGLDPN